MKKSKFLSKCILKFLLTNFCQNFFQKFLSKFRSKISVKHFIHKVPSKISFKISLTNVFHKFLTKIYLISFLYFDQIFLNNFFTFSESSNGGMFFANAYMPFNAETCFFGSSIKNRPLFDISYVHMRYNKTAVEMVMKPDTKKITILRNPLDNFISSWRYYNGLMKDMRRMLPKAIVEKMFFLETNFCQE